MPGLCGLLNHSCERRWRRVPLPAGACPLVGFFVIGFSFNANARADVRDVDRCDARQREHVTTARLLANVSSQSRYYSWVVGNAIILYGWRPFRRARGDCWPLHLRTLPLDPGKTEIEHGLLGTLAFDRLDQHRGSSAAHFITVGPHARQRRHRGGHEFEVVEADDRDLLR